MLKFKAVVRFADARVTYRTSTLTYKGNVLYDSARRKLKKNTKLCRIVEQTNLIRKQFFVKINSKCEYKTSEKSKNVIRCYQNQETFVENVPSHL